MAESPSERDRLADARDREADQRDRDADERERQADLRDRIADARDREDAPRLAPVDDPAEPGGEEGRFGIDLGSRGEPDKATDPTDATAAPESTKPRAKSLSERLAEAAEDRESGGGPSDGD